MVAGSYGNGSIVQTGGTLNATTVLYVALAGSGVNTGAYSVSGAGTVVNANQLNIGVSNTGTFTQTGGVVNAPEHLYGLLRQCEWHL